jgi:hypothetical protein
VDVDGLPIPVVVAAAFMSSDLAETTTAKSLLAQCEMRLAAPQVEIAQATAATLVVALAPAPEPAADAPPATPATPAPEPPEPPAAPTTTTTTKPEAPPAAAAPLRLDPLLDELAAGNTRALTEKLPQVIGRLLPVFRLLGPNQRAQLIQFLQRLG